ACVELCGEVLWRAVDGCRVAAVEPGHGVEHERGVFGGAGHWSGVVERPGQWHYAEATHPTVGWLDARRAAAVAGNTDGAGGVAAGSAEAHAGSERGGRAATRAAGVVTGFPRVVDRPVMRI